ncbi:hypothetical protein HanRHA438_Chr04g0186941 [Helianthus annuus]|uniref:DUF538 domain-containing protein n=1 Tax=Helianthus annuus TaxID=4232 RepID=A0A251V0E8_HELAN|nr:uncharacterized protein LOC110937075 [Helianthus annuus]KAF5811087.1 hypothetical protein HanXRQr2_Chr04g0177371 [Helianthus annuus]KAJ0581799.1 hypothetical protein HanHA300_Chr04g0145241 [Helianthus annuus]KAJ0589868.1 hypothetical protein HanIR_Chr04g0191081 [Helianthus annuus]KAJ0758414.1 hypothetical protein HanLR1_Chr04g0150141 [Helianthus annuus]KAJ0762068.1 hypothetical protein HanOQP8_Chr04g0157271 [Helianthus annuus]
MRSHLFRRTTGSPSPATPLILLPSLLLLLISTTITAAAAASDTPTAYDELLTYDFPVGLLPIGVTGYELNKNTGEFKAYLPETCSFKIQGYNLQYKSTISGVIEKGRLKNLKGINVKILVVWLNIVEVSRHGDELAFSVGIMSAGFGVDNFVESPQCGCGFDCNKLYLDDLLMSSY